MAFAPASLLAQSAAQDTGTSSEAAQKPSFKVDSESVSLKPSASPGDSAVNAAIKEKTGLFGNLPVDITGTLRTGYDSNVYYSTTNQTSSLYTSVGGSMAHSFSGARLQVKTLLGGGASIYYNEPGNKILYNANFSTEAEYKLAPKLLIRISDTTQYLPQPAYQLVGGSTQYNSAYIYEDAKIELAAQVTPKLSAVSAYDLLAFYYMESAANKTQGYVTQTLSESIQHLLLPKTTLIVEGRIAPTTYYVNGQYSMASYLLGGVNQTFNPRLRFTARAGGEYITNQNAVSGSSSSILPFLETKLIYNFGPASTLAWDLRYGTESSGLANVNMSQTFRTGLTAMHALTPRIAINLSLYYINNQYDQPAPASNYSKNTGQLNFDVMYKLNRYLSVELGYSYSQVASWDQTGIDYNRQVIFVGGAIAL